MSIEDHSLTALLWQYRKPDLIPQYKLLLEKSNAACNASHSRNRVWARDMNIDLSEDLLSALVLTLCVLSCARLRNSMPTKIFLSCCYLWNENNRTHRESLNACSTINSCYGPVGHRTNWQGKKMRKQEAVHFIPTFLWSRAMKGETLSSALEKRSKNYPDWLIHMNMLRVTQRHQPQSLHCSSLMQHIW